MENFKQYKIFKVVKSGKQLMRVVVQS